MRVIAFAAALSLAWLSFAASAQAQFKTPDDAVRALYGYYRADGNGFPREAKTVRRFFEPGLAKRYLSVKSLDADFFIQGQDFELKGLNVGPAKVQGDKATVPVAFTNFGKPERLTFELVRGKDGWRIADAQHGRSSFRNSLR